MLEAKVLEGKSTEEIADQFGVKKSTVYAAMSLAKKAEVVVQFEDRLYNELLPLAHSAVLGALADGNAKIGLAVLQGTQVLRPNQARSQNQMAEDDELARYVNAKRARAALEEQTIDGTLAEVPRLAATTQIHDEGSPLPSPEPPETEPAGAPSAGPRGLETAEALLSAGTGD